MWKQKKRHVLSDAMYCIITGTPERRQSVLALRLRSFWYGANV